MPNPMRSLGSNTFYEALNAVSLHEQGRTVLAGAMLENIAALSAMEQHYCQIAPTGAHRYKKLLDACNDRFIDTLNGW